MEIEVLRIGQRLVRDDRVTTHVALVARAFGATKIYMNEVNPEISETINRVNGSWGNNFKLQIIEDWKKVVRKKKAEGYNIIHLTMYGLDINEASQTLYDKKKIFVIVGAEKVPRIVYDLADYNVSVGTQPHSEISALAVFLDRIQKGSQFDMPFKNWKRKIIPTNRGKKVVMDQRRD